jgi:hypothetical protein
VTLQINRPHAYVLRAIKTLIVVSPPHPALTLTLSQRVRGRKTSLRGPTQPSSSMGQGSRGGEMAAHAALLPQDLISELVRRRCAGLTQTLPPLTHRLHRAFDTHLHGDIVLGPNITGQTTILQ